VFLWNAILVNAAHKMHTLESYGWAMTGAIMGLIMGLGLITSIWCLIVLSKPESEGRVRGEEPVQSKFDRRSTASGVASAPRVFFPKRKPTGR